MKSERENSFFSKPFSLSDKLEALKLWGRSTHSFSSLCEGVQPFRLKGVKGYIPIVLSKGLILISGEPVCDIVSAQVLVGALKEYAKAKRCSIGAIPVGEMTRQALELSGFSSVYIGKEPVFELKKLPQVSKSIRQGAERARRKGLRVVPYDERYRMQMELLTKKWQLKTELPQMGFLFQLHPLEFKEFKKYFLVVDKDDRLNSYLACSPIYARNGWYLEDLIRDHNAPNGCTELMMTEALKTLAIEGYTMATLALAPLAGLPDRNESVPWLNRILRLCYKHLSFIYHFQTLEYFKAKFHPSYWENNYFCYYSYAGESLLLLAMKLIRSFLPMGILTIVKHKIGKWFS